MFFKTNNIKNLYEINFMLIRWDIDIVFRTQYVYVYGNIVLFSMSYFLKLTVTEKITSNLTLNSFKTSYYSPDLPRQLQCSKR